MNRVERVKKFLLGVPEPAKCEDEKSAINKKQPVTIEYDETKPYFTMSESSFGEMFADTEVITYSATFCSEDK